VFPGRANPLGQALLFELKADSIVFWVGKGAQTLDHAQDEKDRGINSDRNAGIALFKLDKRGAADRRPLRGNLDRDSSAPTGVSYVVTQLPKGMPDRNGKCDRCSTGSHI
jgi:hypothetical protein